MYEGLFIAIITQAIQDAVYKGKNRELLFHKHVARDWLFSGNGNFHFICHAAGLDPSYVQDLAGKAIEQGYTLQKPVGQGKYWEYNHQRYLKKKGDMRHPLETRTDASSLDDSQGLEP